jgi:hypothetical protein
MVGKIIKGAGLVLAFIVLNTLAGQPWAWALVIGVFLLLWVFSKIQTYTKK